MVVWWYGSMVAMVWWYDGRVVWRYGRYGMVVGML